MLASSIAFVAGLGLVVLLTQAILGPILVWLTFKMKLQKFLPCSNEQLSSRARKHLESAAIALIELGFEWRGNFSNHGSVEGACTYGSLWVHPERGDMASAIHTSQSILSSAVVGFDTQFSNGFVIATSNVRDVTSREVPWCNKLSIPKLTDLALLYRIHRARVEQHSPEGTTLRTPVVGMEREFAQEDVKRDLEGQVSIGRYWKDEESGEYRLTCKGACITTWGLIWPVSAIRRVLRRRRALGELEAMGFGAFSPETH